MKICLVTGSRAEYGILKNLMRAIKNDKKFKLKIIATGTHLSEKHGNTFKEIENDGFNISKKVNIDVKLLSSNNLM